MVFQVFNGPPHKKPRLSNIALKRGPRNSPGLGTRPLRYKIVQRDKQPFWGEIGWAGQWRQARWGLLLKYVGPMKAGIALLRGWRGCPSQCFCVFLEMSYQLFFTSERKNMKKKVSGKTVTSEIPSPKQSVLLRGHLVEVEIDKLRALLGAVEAMSLEALIQNDPTSD